MKHKDIEIISVLADRARKNVLIKTVLTRQEFRYLLIANHLTDKRAKFSKGDINDFIGNENYRTISEAINKMTELNFVEVISNKRIFGSIGKVGTVSAYYAVSGKGKQLIRKYTNELINLMSNEER